MFMIININTFSKFTHFIINTHTHTHTHTHVTAVTNGAIKVTLNETTHNRTLVKPFDTFGSAVLPIGTHLNYHWG